MRKWEGVKIGNTGGGVDLVILEFSFDMQSSMTLRDSKDISYWKQPEITKCTCGGSLPAKGTIC